MRWQAEPLAAKRGQHERPLLPCDLVDPVEPGSERQEWMRAEASAAALAADEAAAAEIPPSGHPYLDLLGASTRTEAAAGEIPPVGAADGVEVGSDPFTLGRCAPPVGHADDAITDTSAAQLWRTALELVVRASTLDAGSLGANYDRTTFRTPLPPTPATNKRVILSVIVVVPEAAALLLFALTSPGGRGRGGKPLRRRRWWRDHLGFVLILATGVVSMTGIGVLAQGERAGAEWTASAVRANVGALRTEPRVGFEGALLFHTELLMTVTVVGYRLALVGWIAVGLLAGFATVSVLCGVRIGGGVAWEVAAAVGWRERSQGVGLTTIGRVGGNGRGAGGGPATGERAA